ncbi:MAG TPA: isoleucine--tRNA ligase [Gemmatimonadales bacterium]|nr:isoleucine--tRNA ligase [Gemmatimonadales bacterium]
MAFLPWPEGTADQLEREMLARWAAEGLFRQTMDATRDGKPFVFFEGPPTANGRPGIHHVVSRTIKDLICRYQTMQGRSVTRTAGWDTHGLPVEIEIEKELQLSGKPAIEAFGVAEFNRRARESVFRYKEDWEALSDRIGYWLDYEHPYVTYSADYVESVWWLLARLHERKLLYRGHRVLPYCPRCGTVLSSHELAQGYEEVTTNSVYVTFPLADGSGRELLVWTTTPWTLLSNVAVAVHPDLEYGDYRVGDRTFVLATARAALPSSSARGAPAFQEIGAARTYPGRKLLGLRYTRPLDMVDLPPDRASCIVVPAGFVSAEDGSGLVHMAPAFGADDHAAGKEHGLALVRPVAADGTFEGTGWPEIEGRLVTARETNDLIIRRLKADGRWHLTVPYAHSYPHCWRCRSPLIYYARDSWFVRTSLVKERMLEFNRLVAWHPPEVGAGRFGEWLENNVDWALSRDRYWGTPLPVWVCDRDDQHVEVIGSFGKLAERHGRPLGPDFDPHKPGVDAFTWACACGGTMRRTPEVIDAWFDSGSMPYAQWHYPFEHEEEFHRHFPADYICEGVDQTRGWFYSLLAIATAAFDSPAYRNVIVNELVLDADGQKMSKSRGNVVDPWATITEFGADAVRLYLLASSQVWLPKRFDPRGIPEVAGGFLNTLRNTYEFFRRYAGDAMPGAPGTPLPADQWILSRLEATVAAVHEAWGAFDVTAGTRALMDFVVDDLSNWYVRTNRARFWAPDREPDPAAVRALHTCLVTVARLLAPAAPFASDWMHRALTGSSVHLARLPGAGARDAALEGAMDAVRRLATLARAAREGADLRVRQPLARMRVAVPAAVRGEAFDRLLPLLATEVNVKEVAIADSDADLVRLRARPNFRALGRKFGSRTPAVASAASALAPDALRTLESGGEVSLDVGGEAVRLTAEDVAIEREVTSDWLVQSSGAFVAALDPALDDRLRAEGLAREMVNRVQRLRKEAGLEYTSRIALFVDGDAAVLDALRPYAAAIGEETLARQLDFGRRAPAPEYEQRVELDGTILTVGLARYERRDGRADPQRVDHA